MKMKTKNMTFCIGVGLLLAVASGWGLYHYKYAAYKELAGNTLTEALWQEMGRRDTVPVEFSTMLGNTKKRKTKVRDIQVSDTKGTHTYKMDTAQYQYNIGDDGEVCSRHSYLLWKRPMYVDTLYNRWQELMAVGSDSRLPVALRLSLCSPQENRVSYFPNDTTFIIQADSLLSRTVGYMNEWEITVLLRPVWYQFLNALDWLLILFLFGLCPGLYVCYAPLRRWYRHNGAHPEIVEKEVPVVIGNFKTEIFSLDKQVRFNAKEKLLYDTATGAQVKLPPLETRTLKIILEATDHALNEMDFVQLLWPDEKEVDIHRLHSAIGRLRKKLSKISEARIEKNGPDYYLFFPTDISHPI